MTTTTNTDDSSTDRDPTFLRKGGIRQRMKCDGSMASRIEDTFVTVGQLLDAIESEEELTDVDGVGPKTAEVIEDWYGNREERERRASSSTMKRTSSKSLSISFHQSWADELGMEVEDSE